MIIVDGRPVSVQNSTSPGSGREILATLLEDPFLAASSNRLKAIPERNFSAQTETTRHVYVFQKEYATVDPKLVQLVGTDELTTCVGLVIRNRNTGMTSVSHMDVPEVVDEGLKQMLQFLGDDNTTLDVHLIGGFEDVSTEHVTSLEGYSYQLCCKIVEALQKSQEEFNLQTFCILKHNTMVDSYGNARPVIGGFLVDTSSGQIMPASFDISSRCPDEIVRRVRTCVSWDPSGEGQEQLLYAYDGRNDKFHIPPLHWMSNWGQKALEQQQLSDAEILGYSTSPTAEPPDFVDNIRRALSYLIEYPDWRQTFPGGEPRIFQRTSDGGWSRCP